MGVFNWGVKKNITQMIHSSYRVNDTICLKIRKNSYALRIVLQHWLQVYTVHVEIPEAPLFICMHPNSKLRTKNSKLSLRPMHFALCSSCHELAEWCVSTRCNRGSGAIWHIDKIISVRVKFRSKILMLSGLFIYLWTSRNFLYGRPGTFSRFDKDCGGTQWPDCKLKLKMLIRRLSY